MKKYATGLLIVLLITLTGCKKDKIIDYRNIEQNVIDVCTNDCISDENDLKEQLQIMIDALDQYMEENDYLIEGCIGDIISRSCFEDLEGEKWSNYLDYRDHILLLKEQDIELIDGVLTAEYELQYGSLIDNTRSTLTKIYMNDKVLKLVSQFNAASEEVLVVDFTNGYRYEEWITSTNNNDEIRNSYSTNYDGTSYTLAIKHKNGEVLTMDILISTNENTIYSTNSYEDESISGMNIDDGMMYIYNTNNGSKYYRHGSDGTGNIISFRDFSTEEISDLPAGWESQKYVVQVDALQFDFWTDIEIEMVESDFISQFITSYQILNDGEEVNNLNGYEFTVNYSPYSISLLFEASPEDVEDLIDMLDENINQDLNYSLSETLQGMYEFQESPEDFLVNDNLIYDVDEDFIKEFFDLD